MDFPFESALSSLGSDWTARIQTESCSFIGLRTNLGLPESLKIDRRNPGKEGAPNLHINSPKILQSIPELHIHGEDSKKLSEKKLQ